MKKQLQLLIKGQSGFPNFKKTIWIDDEKILKNDLGATLIKENITFSGFGGEMQQEIFTAYQY